MWILSSGESDGAGVIEEDFEDKWEAELEAGTFQVGDAAAYMQGVLEGRLPISLEGLDEVVDDWFQCRSDPQTFWEIELAWSEYKESAWSAKKVTEEALTVSFRSKEPIFLKPSIAQSQVLDQTQVPSGETPVEIGGRIVAPPMESGQLIISCYSSRPDNVVARGFFRFTGCNGRVVVRTYEEPVVSPTHLFDASVSLTNMQFVEDEGVDLPLILPSNRVDAAGNWTGNIDYLTALNETPGQFTLAVPHQYIEYASQDDLFYQDETRCFHVVPRDQAVVNNPLLDEDFVTFEAASRSMLPNQSKTEDDRIALRHPVGCGARRSAQRRLGRTKTIVQGSATLIAHQRKIAIQDLLDQSGAIASDGTAGGITLQLMTEKVFDFNAFYHPHVCTFFEEINGAGVGGLMQRSVQSLSSEFFKSTYDPDLTTVASYPLKDVDFADAGAFSPYNWELFFHAPLLIAARLSQNQRFEEAQRWFHYIFNPTLRVDPSDVIGPERYWVFYPFYLDNTPQDINTLLLELNAGDPALEEQVAQWREHPFNPHLIARLRPGAYQKTVVMKYLDNLIAWGDSLFRRDTIEAINEATQLYVLAADLLGTRPESLPTTAVEDNQTYNTLAAELDEFSNALVEIEDQFPTTLTSSSSTSNVPLPTLAFYFCIPNNEQLLGYWDTVADRLFKIRNCMNIEGVVRQLALFEPPIDPALLVAATAAGVDLSSVLNDLYAPLPPYRCQFMLQKAVEFCSDVRSLGGALLAALANEDAEELALLRASHEKQVVESIQQIREKQVDEAMETVAGLEKSKALAEARQQYYANREYTNSSENLQLSLLRTTAVLQAVAQISEISASIAHGVPDAYAGGAGVYGSPLTFLHTSGGSKVAAGIQAFSRATNTAASIVNIGSSLAGSKGSFDRRAEEWAFQAEQAGLEIQQIDKQIAAAQIRVAIAEQERDNHNQQIEHAQEVYDFMSGKYTNQELYSWMVTQISSIYFTSYQMAYDLAKRAEKAYQHELGVTTSFITFGYWDSLKKGLHLGGTAEPRPQAHGDVVSRSEQARI